jgi:hypothetical protein
MQKFILIVMIFIIVSGCNLVNSPTSEDNSKSPLAVTPTIAPSTPISTSSLISTPTPKPISILTVTSSTNSLDDILKILKSKKDIFNIVESPNKKYVFYMQSATFSEYDTLTLHLWFVGEAQPQDNGKIEEDLVGEVLWSPNSDYIFVDTGTFVTRGGRLYSVDRLKEVTSLEYKHTIYFSPDGKNILYSGSDEKKSDIKGKYIDPSDIFNLYTYDIATKTTSKIMEGTNNEDYSAIGWLDDLTISYDLNKYSDPNGEFKVDNLKYKYDMKSKQSVIDEPKIIKSEKGKDYTGINIELNNQKDAFGDIWSPDHRTLVYVKGNKIEGLGKVMMWRVGEEKSTEIILDPLDTVYPVGNLIWSPDSKLFIFHMGVYPESGGYLVEVDNKKATLILFFETPFFSSDSKFLLFTGIEYIQSPSKIAGSGASFNLSILDLTTLKSRILLPATDKVDYFAMGWSGENKIVYKKHDFSNNTDEILEYELKQG